jgi:integrase-like protein
VGRVPSCGAPRLEPVVRRRFAPHRLRHAHAVEMAREGVPLVVIQRQLGHSNLGITSVYLQGIDNAEIIETVHARRAPDDPGHHLAARPAGRAALKLRFARARRASAGRAPRPSMGGCHSSVKRQRRTS